MLAAIALALNWLFFRSERRTLAEVGLDAPRVRAGQAVLAFAAGLVVVIAWAFILFLVTGVRWQRAGALGPAAAFAAFAFLFFNNAAEEFVYRAYLFVTLARSFHTAVAVVVTCGLFTLLHIQGGVPWPNALAGVFTSALMFAALFARWRSVPLVLSFHLATNFAQEFLGIRTTGLTLFAPVYRAPLAQSESTTVLVATAALNIAVAAAVFALRRRDPIKFEA